MPIKYYIPIQSVNLAHYYSNGIICPACYLENKNKDIQNKFDNYLLLSTEKFTVETDCSLEIVFNEPEEKPFPIVTEFYLFDMPLPISRVKAIHFQSEAQKTNTVFNITSGAAFLPIDLVKVDTQSLAIETTTLDDFQPKKTSKSWHPEITRFNNILGGIALMSISKVRGENYPVNYFSILSYLNLKIKEQLEQQNITTKDYTWSINPDSQFQLLNKIIFSEIDDLFLETIAINDSVKLQTRNGLYLLDAIPPKTNTYLTAILATYGNGKRKKTDDFISDFFQGKFEKSRLEGIAFIFGINKGYSSFRNAYNTSNFNVNVKFKMESQLDFYTIESVYQFMFNKKKENEQFAYIDEWCPKQVNELTPNQKSFRILDTNVNLVKTEIPDVLDKLSSSVIQLLKSWLPVFQPNNTSILKSELEAIFTSNIEQYRNSIILQERESYQSIIDIKNSKIASLEEKLRLLKSEKPNEAMTSKMSDSKVAEPETIYKTRKTTSHLNEGIGLFAQVNSNVNEEKLRADQLFNLGIGKLKEIAKAHSINGISKFANNDKAELVREILRIEFPKA